MLLRLPPHWPRVLLLAVFAASAFAADPRGDNPNAKLLAAADSRALFHLPPGFEIQLVAAEPEIEKPFNLAFDSAGRVWVTGSKIYPWPAKRDALGEPIASFEKQWGDTGLAFRAASTPPEPPERGVDTLRVLSDFDPATGRARRSEVFADGLNIPVGVLPLPRAPGAKGDSVIVFSIPAIWKLTDTDGDGRADVREKLYDGFGFKDTHGMSSSYWLWFDGWVYGTHGFANASEVVDRAGRVVKLTSGNTYRFRPDGSRFEVFVNGQTNPFGLAFDARGDLYTADSHSKPVYLLIPGGYYEGINREHDGLGFAPAITTDDHGSSAIAGIAHYSATQFPPEFRDNLFNGNPVTRRINRTRLEWRGSTPLAARQPDFLTSDDQAFRPVQVKLGPDGALWIADFYNPIIGHYEAPLTHPARDKSHGRVWRIVWRGLDGGAPAPAWPNLAKLKTADLAARGASVRMIGESGGAERARGDRVRVLQFALEARDKLRHDAVDRRLFEPRLADRQTHQLEGGIEIARQRLEMAGEVIAVDREMQMDGEIVHRLVEAGGIVRAGALVEQAAEQRGEARPFGRVLRCAAAKGELHRHQRHGVILDEPGGQAAGRADFLNGGGARGLGKGRQVGQAAASGRR